MNSSKTSYFGIAAGMLILFLFSSITFIIIGINKDGPLFDNVAIYICLTMGLFVLLLGFGLSLYQALKKNKISEE